MYYITKRLVCKEGIGIIRSYFLIIIIYVGIMLLYNNK